MTIKKHKDYSEEVKRLEDTKEYMEQTIGAVNYKRDKFNDDIKDAYLNLDYLDSSLSYSTIMLNTTLLEDLEKNFALLVKSRLKPYFARIDIKQDGKDHFDKLYIGKVSLYDKTMDNPLVVDWRAPVASVYYDGRIGDTNYAVGDITHNIELAKKRQYTIEDGELVDFVDVDISTSDAFLQASLHSHASEKLKDIVSTIQAEQNRIIRADMEKPLIVQGVAGSGKTTIALHRIAYLIYTYADTIYPEQFMIIAPNSLFLDYISGVLPELGAERVRQTTYEDLMFDVIGKKLKMTSYNEKLNDLISTEHNKGTKEHKELIASTSTFKNSMDMKDLLDSFISSKERDVPPAEDMILGDHIIITCEEVTKLFFDNYNYLPVYKRVEMIKNYIKALVKNRTKEILKNTDGHYSKKIDAIRYFEEYTDESRTKILKLIDQRDRKLENINKESKTIVKRYMSKFKGNDLFTLYNDFLETQNISHHDSIIFEIEDLASLAYLKKRMFGLDEDLDTKMVVIDEAQDFSNFQFYVLREVLNTDRFTILGDLSQGIHMYRAINSWDYLKDSIFTENPTYLTLEQSYRTTIEIMEEANRVLSKLQDESLLMAKPVVRHGSKPIIRSFKEINRLIDSTIEKIDEWKSQSITTIAVIAKSAQEAKLIHKLIKRNRPDIDIKLVDEKLTHFDSQILVIPTYLSKGLEFDAVIIAVASEKYETNPLDVKLMYVSMTRAMHKLAIFYRDKSIQFYGEMIN